MGLPAQVKAEEITANFENGILTIMVPRAQKAQPKRIPVTMAGREQSLVIDAPAMTVAGVPEEDSGAERSEGSTPVTISAE